jgi:integrase
MTNVQGIRKTRMTVVQDAELTEAIDKADDLSTHFFQLRAKATLSIGRLSGKRAGELAMLPRKNIQVSGKMLNVDWILEKKRTTVMMNKMSHKAYPLSDQLTQHVINWLTYLDATYPGSQYFLPSARSSFGNYVVDLENHVTPRTILNIVRSCSEMIWPHLFRETLGADIVNSNNNTVAAMWDVVDGLDLDPKRGFETASRYVRRYSRQIVQRPTQVA